MTTKLDPQGFHAPTGREGLEATRRELAKFELEYGSIEETLEIHVKVLRRMVEALRNETIGEGVTASKARGVSDLAVKKAKELTAALASAVQAQNALAKTAKLRAEKFTPEERRRALLLTVARMPAGERRAFIRAVAEQHEATIRKGVELGIETAEETDFVRLI